MHTARRAVIVGAGEIGSAIGKVLRKNGVTVELWDRDPARTPRQKELRFIVPQAAAVFLCVPSGAVRAAARSIAPYLAPRTVVIALAKGIERSTGKTVDRVLAEALPKRTPFALLGGPMLAEELVKGMAGMAVVASASRAPYAALAKLFAGSNVRLERCGEVRAAALLGVLKNVYAVALGIAHGLDWGSNEKGWLTVQAMREMGAILARFGESAGEAAGLVGLGDLVATGYSSYSRNQWVGYEIAKNGRCAFTSEGITSLPWIRKKARPLDKFPVLRALDAVVHRGKDVRKAFARVWNGVHDPA